MLSGLTRTQAPEWLQTLAASDGAGLDDLDVDLALAGSVFVPLGGVDMRPWRYLAGAFHSFVFVGHGPGTGSLADRLHQALADEGYSLIANRRVQIAPKAGGRDQGTDDLDREVRSGGAIHGDTPIVARWLIFRPRAMARYPDSRSFESFSVLVTTQDPLSAYALLYRSRGLAPACVTALPSAESRGEQRRPSIDQRAIARLLVTDPDRLPIFVLDDGSMWDQVRELGYIGLYIADEPEPPDHALLLKVLPRKRGHRQPMAQAAQREPPLPIAETVEGGMRIAWLLWNGTPEYWSDAHILTVAEMGFSMLAGYGHEQHKVDPRTLSEFSERINFEDEPATLHPVAPISAIPRRFFREGATVQGPGGPRRPLGPQTREQELRDFRRHIARFLEENRRVIRASKILVDLHVGPFEVRSDCIRAIEEIFCKCSWDGLIKDLAIVV